MTHVSLNYEEQNIQQVVSEDDPFTLKRYEQFYKFFPLGTRKILDVGCNTGRGGLRLKELNSSYELYGLDCVKERLAKLPDCYADAIYGLSNEIPVEDKFFDAIVAGEFLEHLYPADVDKTLCEFQRILKIGGRLLLTTPNPAYLRLRLTGGTVFSGVHLTQHFPSVLKTRMKMHGFSRIRIYGSGKVSRYIGCRVPFRMLYGSYLISGDKK